MIIYIDTIDIKLKDISKYVELMPLDRQIEYYQMIKEEDKINCILAFLMIKNYYLTAGYSELNFLYNANGKPYIENNPIFFNISHSKNIVAVGFDHKNELGIDIEKIEDIDNDIINILYSNIEKEKYKNILLDKNIFYKAWTMKESYAKMLGLGLYFDFTSISLNLDENISKLNVYYIHSFKIEDYYLAISAKNTNCQIIKIKLDDLIGGTK